MTTRKRIVTKQPAVTGGGGSVTTFGNVEWGPDFGEPNGSDGVSYRFSGAADLDAISVANTKQVTDTVDLFAIANDNTTTVRDTVSGALGVENTRNVQDFVDLDAIAVAGQSGVVDTVDLFSIANSGDVNQSAHLSGSVLGAPFYQTGTTASDNSALGVGSLAISKPSGVAVGDLLLIFCAATWSSASSPTVPGFTQVLSNGVANQKVWVGWRLADGSEGSSFTVTFPATATNPILACHRVNGVHQTTPINAAISTASSVTDPVLQSVTTTAANCLVYGVVSHAHLTTDTHTPPAGHVERNDLNVGTVPNSLWVGARVFAATGAVGTATVDCTEIVASNAAYGRFAVAPGSLEIAA